MDDVSDRGVKVRLAPWKSGIGAGSHCRLLSASGNELRPPRVRPLAIILPILLLSAAAMLRAQVVPEGFNSGTQYQPQAVPDERTGFTFCRLVFNSIFSEPMGIGWSTDYPAGDRNFMIRLGEFTNATITHWPNGQPAHALVEPTDAELFGCPFLFASDAGTAGFSPAESERLREYFEKGGFLWADDFWGDRALSNFLVQFQRILPGSETFEIGFDHPLFSSFYFVEQIPQIPSIQFWLQNGGETSERGIESRNSRMYGINDSSGRLAVVMTHNTDIADGWEREAANFEFFHLFSPFAYALGVNVAVFAMTH